jgi:hypothetical protein
LTEVLIPVLRFIDRDRERDFLYVRRNVRKVDVDLLIIAIAYTCPVVARMNDGAVLVLAIVEVDEVALALNLARCVSQEDGYVKVKVFAAVVFVCVPAKAHRYFRQSRVCFRQIDLLAFRQTNCQGKHLSSAEPAL